MSRLSEIFNEYYKSEEYLNDNFLLDFLFKNMIIKGNITQIVGESSTGKTSISLQITKKLCDQNHNVVYIDTNSDITNYKLEEFSLAPMLGTRFHLIKASRFDIVDKLITEYANTNSISFIVIDSIASLINPGYINNDKSIDVTNNNTNIETRPLINLIKKLVFLSKEFGIHVLLINEYRNRIDNKIGSIKKIYGPKMLFTNTNNIIEMSKANKGSDVYSILDKVRNKDENVVKLKVTKTNVNSINNEVLLLIPNNKQLNESMFFVSKVLSKYDIKKQGTYYEIKELNIKANGSKQFIEDILKFKMLVDRS